MDPIYISAIVTSIQNVFSTMFQLPVEVGEPSIKQERTATHDVSGIIGVSGSMVGTIVLSMPEETATAVISLFTGMEIETDSADFADAVGEIVNMISGGAKASFQRKDVMITCPSVVIGSGHIVSHQSGSPCVLIPCTTDCGEVVIELSLREAIEETASTQAAA
jgi:chemotaxis protein CheX